MTRPGTLVLRFLLGLSSLVLLPVKLWAIAELFSAVTDNGESAEAQGGHEDLTGMKITFSIVLLIFAALAAADIIIIWIAASGWGNRERWKWVLLLSSALTILMSACAGGFDFLAALAGAGSRAITGAAVVLLSAAFVQLLACVAAVVTVEGEVHHSATNVQAEAPEQATLQRPGYSDRPVSK